MTNKNFVKQNAIETILAVPRMPDKVYVDTKGGDKQNLLSSGMEPVYVHKKVRDPFVMKIEVDSLVSLFYNYKYEDLDANRERNLGILLRKPYRGFNFVTRNLRSL